MYVYVCMYVCMHACLPACMYVCMHVCGNTCVNVFMYICIICTYVHMYMCVYVYICICICIYVYACGPKTVPVKRTFLNIAIVGWSGVGWGGMLTFLVLRTWYIAMLLRSLGSFTTLHVATLLMGWGGVGGHVNVPCTSCMIYCHAAEIFGIVYYVKCADGVGWGVMLTFLVLRTWYIAMLLRSLGLFTTLHVATLLRSLGSFTTLHVATLLRSLGSFTTLHAATLLRSLGSFTTLHVLCGIWWKSQFLATWVPKVTSWWCMLELGNGDAFTRMLTASW